MSLEREGLELGHAKRTVLAGIAAVVMRSRPHAWLPGVERSRSRYFVDWLKPLPRARCSPTIFVQRRDAGAKTPIVGLRAHRAVA